MKIGNQEVSMIELKDEDGKVIARIEDGSIKIEKGYQIKVAYEWQKLE